MRIADLAFSGAFVVSLAVLVGPARAEEAPEELGTAIITTNLAFPKALVDDDEYGAIEYTNGGKVCLIKNLPLKTSPHRILLTPHEEGYTAETVEVQKAAYKKKRKGRALTLEAAFKVTFKKSADAPKPEPKPDQPTPDKPKPDEDKDDL